METRSAIKKGREVGNGGPSLSKQSLWILSAKSIGFGLSVLLPLIVVRQLTQDDVGIYRQAFLVIVSATAILPLGFSMSAYYFLNRDADRRAATVLNIVLFNFISGGVAFVALATIPTLLGDLFRDEQMSALSPVVGLAIWLAIFSAFLETAALANKEAKLATGIIIFAQLSKAALMSGAAVIFRSADAIVYAAVIQGAGQTLVLIFFLRSRFPGFWRRFDWSFFKQHLLYALPFGFAGLLYTAQADLHHYFVAREFSSADYAVYAYGCFQLPLIWALYESISAVLLPRMSSLQSEGKTREILLLSVSGMQKLAFAYFPLFAFLSVTAEVFVTTLFTERFAASVPVFRVNLLLLPLYCLILDPVERSFQQLGNFLTRLRTLIIAGLAISLYFGVQYLSLPGVVAIVVAAALLDRIIAVWKVLTVLDVKRSDVYLLGGPVRTAAATVVAGTALLAFYMLTKDVALAGLVDLAGQLLAIIGFAAGAELLGGLLYLFVCGMLFAPLYLLLANRFGAISPDDKVRFSSVIESKMALLTGHKRGFVAQEKRAEGRA